MPKNSGIQDYILNYRRTSGNKLNGGMTTDVRYFSNWEKYITSQISLVLIFQLN